MVKQIKFINKLLFLLIILIFANNILSAKILMKPWLQAATDNSIVVMIESDNWNAVTVEYGTNVEFGMQAKTEFYRKAQNRRNTTYVHRIRLKNLKANTEYFYKANDNESQTENHSFHTLVEEGTPFRFASCGDFRSNPEVHDRISKYIFPYKPLLNIYNGDMCFNSEYYSWKKEFFVDNEQILSANVPFYTAIGNHEGWEQNTQAFTQSPESPSTKMEYYSFDCGDVHFLILSTQHSMKQGSDQYKFAESDLKNNRKKWTIVVAHEAAYVAGPHENNRFMMIMSQNLFEKYNVNIVLTGHSHFYQRNFVNGIYHLTIAGGGAPLYQPKEASYTQKSVKQHHFAIFDVTSNIIKINVYNDWGANIDSFELNK